MPMPLGMVALRTLARSRPRTACSDAEPWTAGQSPGRLVPAGPWRRRSLSCSVRKPAKGENNRNRTASVRAASQAPAVARRCRAPGDPALRARTSKPLQRQRSTSWTCSTRRKRAGTNSQTPVFLPSPSGSSFALPQAVHRRSACRGLVVDPPGWGLGFGRRALPPRLLPLLGRRRLTLSFDFPTKTKRCPPYGSFFSASSTSTRSPSIVTRTGSRATVRLLIAAAPERTSAPPVQIPIRSPRAAGIHLVDSRPRSSSTPRGRPAPRSPSTVRAPSSPHDRGDHLSRR